MFTMPAGDHSADEMAGFTESYRNELYRKAFEEESQAYITPGNDTASLTDDPVQGISTLSTQLNDISNSVQDFSLLGPERTLEGITMQLDWAAQLRAATNAPWSQCLEIAGVFYYG